MPRVSLETKRTMDNTHVGLAAVLLVLIFVAFGYWCYYVNELRKIEDDDTDGHKGVELHDKNALADRDTVFQAAVVGFLLIITVKHLRDLLYHM